MTNEKPEPATRFNGWTVSRIPIGEESVQVSTGVTFVTQFRKDQLVSFQIHAIPESLMDLMSRLEYHLLNGHIVALAGDRAMADEFALCTLSPDMEPDIQQSDSGNREYTMSLELRAMTPEEIENIPDTEVFYPPETSGGCLSIDSGTSTAGSMPLTDVVKGDNFSAWTASQYAAFLADTETNPNYADGITPSAINNPAPGTFWERNFDWDTNAFVVNRNRIGQLGTHRTVKAIKRAVDGERYQFGFEMELNGSVSGEEFESLWAVTRFKFSENFAVYDQDDPNGRGILLLDCSQSQAEFTAGRTFNAGVFNYGYFPLADPEGHGGIALVEDVLVANMSWFVSGGGGSANYQAVLGTMRELLFTGTDREIAVYAGMKFDEITGFPLSGQFRMAVWIRNVGGSWTKLFDHTLTGLPFPFKTGKIFAFRATDPWVLKASQGDVMCYECGGWKLYNGNGFDDGGVWNPLGLEGEGEFERVLTSIEVTPDPFSIDESETQAMTAQGLDQVGDPIATGTLTWDSSDDAVATVDSSGVVTGVAAGSCTITATAGAITSNAAACTVATASPRETGAFLQLKVATLTAGGYVNDQLVSPWTDATGNGRSPTQATSGAKPIYKSDPIGVGPVVLFEIDDFLNWADGIFSGLTEGEVFFVLAKVEDVPPGDFYTGIWNLGTGADGSHYPFTDGNIYEAFGTTARKTFARPADDMSELHLYNVVSKAGEYTVRFNGTVIYTTATNTVGFPGTLARLGRSKADDYFLRAYVKEVLMFDAAKTTTRRDEIEAEIFSEYGITP